jgi:hypothetical protein
MLELMFKSEIELTTYQNLSRHRYSMAPRKSGFALNSPYEIWDEADQAVAVIHPQKWLNRHYRLSNRLQQPLFTIAAQHPQQIWANWGCLGLFMLGFLCAALPSTLILGCCLIAISLLGLYLISNGYLFNAPYWVERTSGCRVMQFTKNRSTPNRRSFVIQAIDTVSVSEELTVLCSIILIVLHHHGWDKYPI